MVLISSPKGADKPLIVRVKHCTPTSPPPGMRYGVPGPDRPSWQSIIGDLAMKLVRYGPAGREKPGIIDGEGQIRDLSKVVPDLAGDALSP
jgi:hypothetical protein